MIDKWLITSWEQPEYSIEINNDVAGIIRLETKSSRISSRNSMVKYDRT